MLVVPVKFNYMYYTGKGDNGTTTLYNCRQRFSKKNHIFVALGSIDELNCWLGFCSTQTIKEKSIELQKDFSYILQRIQEHLFIIQAQLAGAQKKITATAITELENSINIYGQRLKKRTGFSVPGGSELSALLDIGRAKARTAERAVLHIKSSSYIIRYLNRLSSLLFIFARRVNDIKKIKEQHPHYI